jgi:formate hydrogenlyase subunit 6/NADH:ubiquinone oxidoreductase subunit I
VLTMTRNILRNLVKPRATRCHPYVVRPPFENSRGELVNDIATCTLCGTCAVKCPSQCIQVDKKNATWHYNPYACVTCGVCAESCPSGSLRQERDYIRPVEEMVPVVLERSIETSQPRPADGVS